jgi:branched-chain amino acid transport system substrate-binding protein
MLGFAGCSGTLSGGGSDSVKIGFVLPFSGPYATLGNQIVGGFKLRTDVQLEGSIDGNELEYVQSDTELNPSTGVSIARNFIEEEQVDFIVGPVSSAVAGAMKPVIADQDQAIWINPNAGNYQLVADGCIDYHFRTSFNSWQLSYPFASYIYENVAESVFLSYADYAFGQQAKNFFKEAYEEAGGEVVGEQGEALGSSDYSSLVQETLDSDAEAAYSFFSGSDAVNYINTLTDFDGQEEINQTGSFIFTPFTLEAMNDGITGMIDTNNYTAYQDSERNNKFVQAHQDEYDELPANNACNGYDSAQAIELAVTETGEVNPDSAVDALEGAELDSPRGYFKFSEQTHDPIADFQIREVVEGDSGMEMEVVQVLEQVDSPTWGCSLN